MPAAIEVTNRGLLVGSSIAGGGSEGVDGGRSSGGGVGNGGSKDSVVDQEEAAERSAIADVFRTVDLDASGHVSQQEFLEAVSFTVTRVAQRRNCHVRCHAVQLRRRQSVGIFEVVRGCKGRSVSRQVPTHLHVAETRPATELYLAIWAIYLCRPAGGTLYPTIEDPTRIDHAFSLHTIVGFISARRETRLVGGCLPKCFT